MNHNLLKKKILIFSPIFYPDIGGPAVQGKHLADLLFSNNFDVHVWKYGPAIYNEIPIKISVLNWRANPRFLQRIYRIFIAPFVILVKLIKLKPDLVIVNSVFWNGMLLGLVCRIFKIPSVLKFTGDWVFESTKGNKDFSVELSKIYAKSILTNLMFKLEKVLIGNFKVVWVISEFRRQNVLALSNKPLIWLQRNFHDLPVFTEYRQSRFKPPLLFLTAARLVPHKRIDTIIKVVKALEDDSKLIIVGEGPELQNLKDLTNELCINKRVFFVEKVSRNLLFELMRSASAFISWSSEEGAPNSFIEALNFGLPIISARVGGIPEMFKINSSAAKLLDPDNPDQLVEFLKQISIDTKLLEKMSQEALRESTKYTKDYNYRNFIDLFNKLLKI